MVLNPCFAIWSSMDSHLRAHRPCGAKVPVSEPNQFTPVRTTLWPCESTISPFLVDSGNFTSEPAGLPAAAEDAEPESSEFIVNAVTVPPPAATATTAAAILTRRRRERGAPFVSVVDRKRVV